MKPENRSAKFSECRKYRYVLQIVWDDALPLCQFVGLNPSTADEVQDDPTIRRCKRFARDWNYGGLMMTNLFAYRATIPKDMMAHPHPIGNMNDVYLYETAQQCGLTVAAWGKDGTHLNRAYHVCKLLPGMKCFKLTKNSQPYHPLYMPADAPLIDYALT